MFCSNCGAQIDDQAVFCTKCGASAGGPAAAEAPPGGPVPPPSNFPGMGPAQPGYIDPTQKSKMAAGLLGILVGWLGVHRFYLGYNGIAVAQLVLGLLGFLTCGITTLAAWVWGLIEGIMILTGSINRDAQGRALRD